MNTNVLPPPQRVLLVCVARIGDTLLSTPLARAIKAHWPRAHLTVIAHPKRAELLMGLPFIDTLRGMTKRSAPVRGHLGGKRFDLAFVLGHDAAMLRYALRTARQVVAFRQGSALDRKLHVVAPAPHPLPAADDRLQLLQALGVTATDKRLAYVVSPFERARAQAWRQRHGIPDGARVIGMQATSFPTKAYRNWPVGHFQALVARVQALDPQAWVVLFGDASDAPRVRAIAGDSPRVVCAAGTLTLRQSAAVMAGLSLYVGVDTGPTHIAGALGVPMVALYHCLHPGKYLAPQSHPAFLAVVEHPRCDGPCSSEDTMDAISIDTVWAEMVKALT